MFNFYRKYENSKIIQTDKPYEILKKYPLYDFRILDIVTYTKESSEQKELDKYDINDMEKFNDNDFYLKQELIRQIYTIEIFKKDTNQSIDFDLKVTKTTKVIAILKEGSVFEYYKNLKDDLLMSLYKKMIKYKIFIGIRTNSHFLNDIDNFIENIKKKKTLRLFFEIGKGVEPFDAVREKYICRIEVPDKTEFFHKNNYNNTDLIVKKGELLFEYVKPLDAKIGKDLRGKIVIPQNFNLTFNNIIQVDNTIKKEEKSGKIQYFAMKSGFLNKNDNVYFINDSMHLETLNFKKAKNIDLNNNEKKINIFIQNSDFLQDSIQSGVELNVINAYIKGNVDRSKIKAEKIYIEGNTHFKSYIESDIAYIQTHKGKLKSKIAFVDNLENGEINSEIVFVNNALGGTIKGNLIYIKNCKNYCNVYPKSYVFIEKIVGSMNKFEVNSQKFIEDVDPIVLHYKELSQIVSKNLKNYSFQLKKIRNYLFERQNKIYEFKNLNENTDFVEKYNEQLAQYKDIFTQYKNTLKLSYTINIYLNRVYETAFYAKVAIGSNLGEDNLINFIHKPNEIDMRYILEKNDRFKLFYIQNEDGSTLIKSEKFDKKDISWINIDKKDYF